MAELNLFQKPDDTIGTPTSVTLALVPNFDAQCANKAGSDRFEDLRQELQHQLEKETKALEDAFRSLPNKCLLLKKLPASSPKKPHKKKRARPRTEPIKFEPGDYLTPAQAAQVLHLAEHTLANLRSKGTGPTYAKVCGRIRYLYADLLDFIESGRRQSTSE